MNMMNFIKQELFSAQTNGKIYSKMKCVWSSNQDKPSIFFIFFYYRGKYYWLKSCVVTG